VLVGAAALLGIQLQSYYGPVPDRTVVVIGLTCILIGNFLPDYVSLWKTRYLLKLSIKRSRVFEQILSLIADFLLSIPLAICAFVIDFLVTFVVLGYLNSRLLSGGEEIDALLGPIAAFGLLVSFIPAFFGRIWLLLYVCSGLLLKGAHSLAGGLKSFNRWFDIENYPLQCIGLVGGTLCALGYWILAGIRMIP
jgi:hypothetical protein